MSTTKPLSAVMRTFTILEKLSIVPDSNMEELVRATGLAKPTVYRFLLTLRELGYVRRGEGDRWYLTMKLFGMGSRALDHIDLPVVSRPIARNLSSELGETVHLGILDEDEVLYVLKIESRYTIRMYSRVGKKIPLYCSAMGKILLAHLDAENQAALLSKLKLVPFTSNTIRNQKALVAELEAVKRDGMAMDLEEHEQGITCMAAPIRDSSGAVVAAMSASWPVFRFVQDNKLDYRQKIMAAAHEISGILGYGEQKNSD